LDVVTCRDATAEILSGFVVVRPGVAG